MIKPPLELALETINQSPLVSCLGGNGGADVITLRTEGGRSPTMLASDNQDHMYEELKEGERCFVKVVENIYRLKYKE